MCRGEGVLTNFSCKLRLNFFLRHGGCRCTQCTSLLRLCGFFFSPWRPEPLSVIWIARVFAAGALVLRAGSWQEKCHMDLDHFSFSIALPHCDDLFNHRYTNLPSPSQFSPLPRKFWSFLRPKMAYIPVHFYAS